MIAPLLHQKPHGGSRVDDRRLLSGILLVLRSGSPWRDLPGRCGPFTTAYNRFLRWRRAGIRDAVRDAITKGRDGHIQTIDSSSVRVHKHTAGANKGVQILACAAREAD